MRRGLMPKEQHSSWTALLCVLIHAWTERWTVITYALIHTWTESVEQHLCEHSHMHEHRVLNSTHVGTHMHACTECWIALMCALTHMHEHSLWTAFIWLLTRMHEHSLWKAFTWVLTQVHEQNKSWMLSSCNSSPKPSRLVLSSSFPVLERLRVYRSLEKSPWDPV